MRVDRRLCRRSPSRGSLQEGSLFEQSHTRLTSGVEAFNSRRGFVADVVAERLSISLSVCPMEPPLSPFHVWC